MSYKKRWTIRDNHIIIYPNTIKERDITEELRERKYCICDIKACGHKQPACDFFKFSDDWEEVIE